MRTLSYKKKMIPIILGLAVVLFSLLVKSERIEVLNVFEERLEWIIFDLRMRASVPAKPEPDPRIVIVDIDEKSLAQEGHWPWPRNKLARLVN